ncbi:hypothetical protein ACFQ9Y_18835 [Peribacillus simplex]|uniref:hypothetical protein n=1 Tax=Peribacillus simplex TaxID=1478 RepID=UPI00366CAABB
MVSFLIFLIISSIETLNVFAYYFFFKNVPVDFRNPPLPTSSWILASKFFVMGVANSFKPVRVSPYVDKLLNNPQMRIVFLNNIEMIVSHAHRYHNRPIAVCLVSIESLSRNLTVKWGKTKMSGHSLAIHKYVDKSTLSLNQRQLPYTSIVKVVE